MKKSLKIIQGFVPVVECEAVWRGGGRQDPGRRVALPPRRVRVAMAEHVVDVVFGEHRWGGSYRMRFKRIRSEKVIDFDIKSKKSLVSGGSCGSEIGYVDIELRVTF